MHSPGFLIGALAAFALFVTSCGDDAATSLTTTTLDAGSDLPPDDADSDGTDRDTPEPDPGDDDLGDDETGDSDMDDDGENAAMVGSYCSFSAQAEARSAAFDPSSTLPADVEEFYRGMVALTDQGLETAPAAIAGALEVQRDVLLDTIDLLEASGWDVVASVDDLSLIFESPDFLAASETIEEFDIDVCGFAPAEDPPDDLPPVDQPVDVSAEYAAYCAASFEASETDDLPFDADAAQVEAYYRGLLANLDELSALGPPDLLDDLATVRSNFLEVVSILEGAEWNLDVGFPLVQEWASDPAISDPMDAAIDRVEGFDADVCGIVY